MKEKKIIAAVLRRYPDAQAIYLFGSHGTPDERQESDADIAILLSPAQAIPAGSLALSDLWHDLETALGKTVDLVNLRLAPTVFQNEIIAADRRIHTGDETAAGEFEMLTGSFYQKLNEERAGILEDILAGGRFFQP